MITIVKPSATIVEMTNNICKDIERVGRICYKSEDKITDNSAPAFVEQMMKRGHMSVLEFGIISVFFDDFNLFMSEGQCLLRSKYLHISFRYEGVKITGSLRAFKEVLDSLYNSNYFAVGLHHFLSTKYGSFFRPNISTEYINHWTELFSHDMTLVKFVVSRSISHELVRHRVMSFMQESQRYCRYDECLTVVEPRWFEEGSEISSDWYEHMNQCHERYMKALIHLTPQDARGVLPEDTKTELYCLGTNDQWKQLFRLRCQSSAHPEMQRVMRPLKAEFIRTGRIYND
jgi:thymidylate synthase (FAD)